MPLEILDCCSVASGAANEDRAGAKGAYAWVFDGATDVLEMPLLDGPSDACWFADKLDHVMRCTAETYTGPLAALPAHLAGIMHDELARAAGRQPRNRGEHPSAAGIIVREGDGWLEYVTLGDCTLIARASRGLHVIGLEDMRTGDLWVQEEIRSIQAQRPDADMTMARASLWPMLRAKRALMNEENGYAIFSITPPPPDRVIAGRVALEPGSTVLLATDGLTRLIDVFGSHSEETLHDAALSSGLMPLIAEVRAREAEDADCRAFPRAKTSDDATGLLFRLSD